MNEHERAEWLARTIDDILQGSRLSKRPAGFDDEDIDSLLRVAAGRLQAGEEAGRLGLQYEGLIWQRVLQRLDRRSEVREGDPAYATTRVVPRERAEAPQQRDSELESLREIAEMRRKMALRLAFLSDSYKDEVWRDLQSRIESHGHRKRGWFAFLRRTEDRESRRQETLDSFLDNLEFPEDPVGPHVNNLISTANRRRQMSQLAASYADDSRDEIWQRIQTNIGDHHARESERPGAPVRRRWAFAAGAAVVLTLAALGPIPATGLAHHPAVDAVRFAGGHLGFTETESAPPPGGGTTGTVSGTSISAAEATELLGLPVVAPAVLNGFTLTSSAYFGEPITADEGGAFVLTYDGAGESTITVYQEIASGADFAGAAGSALDVVLSDGTPGTFVEGSWTPSGDGFTWDPEGGQTVIFERDGVRTTMRYTGPAMAVSALLAYAETFA